eukprot:1077019-Amphidinium_carterae.1
MEGRHRKKQHPSQIQLSARSKRKPEATRSLAQQEMTVLTMPCLRSHDPTDFGVYNLLVLDTCLTPLQKNLVLYSIDNLGCWCCSGACKSMQCQPSASTFPPSSLT